MKITKIVVKLAQKDTPVKAFVSVCFDDELVVHDLRVLETVKGLTVAMPAKMVKEDYKDTVHPANVNFRSYLISEVLKAYIAKVNAAPATQDTATAT